MTSPEIMRAQQHAETAMRIADTYGWQQPAEYATATAVAAAAAIVAREPEPLAGGALPDPKKVTAFCDKLAADRAQWRDRVKVAQELHDRATRTAAAIGRSAAPELASRLAKHVNDNLVPTFVDLLDRAPHTLTGHESAEAITAHAEMLRATAALSRAAADRSSLAVASDEGPDLGRHGETFLFIAPPEDAYASAVAAAVRDVPENMPHTIEQWAALVPLGVQFAGYGEAAARGARFNQLRSNAARTIDGDRSDRTLAQLAALAPAAV